MPSKFRQIADELLTSYNPYERTGSGIIFIIIVIAAAIFYTVFFLISPQRLYYLFTGRFFSEARDRADNWEPAGYTITRNGNIWEGKFIYDFGKITTPYHKEERAERDRIFCNRCTRAFFFAVEYYDLSYDIKYSEFPQKVTFKLDEEETHRLGELVMELADEPTLRFCLYTFETHNKENTINRVIGEELYYLSYLSNQNDTQKTKRKRLFFRSKTA